MVYALLLQKQLLRSYVKSEISVSLRFRKNLRKKFQNLVRNFFFFFLEEEFSSD